MITHEMRHRLETEVKCGHQVTGQEEDETLPVVAVTTAARDGAMPDTADAGARTTPDLDTRFGCGVV